MLLGSSSPMVPAAQPITRNELEGQRVALVGRLASMSRRDAQQLIRQRGGICIERPDASAQLIVVGEHDLALDDASLDSGFDATVRQAAEQGRLEVISESELWQRLGLVDEQDDVRRLYTPTMLARLLGVPVSLIRRWHRRGIIKPVREVRRLAYFDFQEVARARRLAELLAAGVTPASIEKKLAEMARLLPAARRSLAQLSMIVEGKQLLLRQDEGLLEPSGQRRLDFDPPADAGLADSALSLPSNPTLSFEAHRQQLDAPVTPHQMLQMAGELEDTGQLAEAAEMYRAALAAGGPSAEINFLLAEVLYQLGDLPAARERYYMCVELNEDYVEARANLGCVLAESGQTELAVAAFQGALTYHADYPDVHYHLARSLDELARDDEADQHWHAFLRLAPDSPWADEVRQRLAMD